MALAALLVMALVHVQQASGSSTGSTVAEDPPLPTTPSFACSSVATVPGYTCSDHWVETDDGFVALPWPCMETTPCRDQMPPRSGRSGSGRSAVC